MGMEGGRMGRGGYGMGMEVEGDYSEMGGYGRGGYGAGRPSDEREMVESRGAEGGPAAGEVAQQGNASTSIREPKYNTSHFAFVVHVIGGKCHPAEADYSDTPTTDAESDDGPFSPN